MPGSDVHVYEFLQHAEILRFCWASDIQSISDWALNVTKRCTGSVMKVFVPVTDSDSLPFEP
jgi:hypothetical protein